jgi:hypothetical protein
MDSQDHLSPKKEMTGKKYLTTLSGEMMAHDYRDSSSLLLLMVGSKPGYGSYPNKRRKYVYKTFRGGLWLQNFPFPVPG